MIVRDGLTTIPFSNKEKNMATIITRAGKGSALTWEEADSNITSLNTDKIESLLDDLTPQLGGNLDINDKTITSSITDGNININPNGAGTVIVDQVTIGQGRGTGTKNTVLGESAFSSATTGNNNIAIGYDSLNGNTNGANNIGIGLNALYRNANTGSNLAIGNNSLDYTVGGSNTAVGHDTGTNLDSGTTNTFIGHSSGSAITNGSYNVILGSNTGSTISGTSNNILISDGQGNIRLSFDSTGNANLNGVLTTDKLQIDTSVITGSTTPGELAWNDGDGTLEFRLKGNNVTLQLGQEQVLMINNTTGSTLTDGQVVYISGSQGQRPTVELASASSEVTSSKTIGVVTESIIADADGFITTNGIVNNLNTSLYTPGTALWLSTTAGIYSATKPTSPDHGVFIGWVIRQHATSGSIYVHIQNGYELDELHNVLIDNPTSNQALLYDSLTQVWRNQQIDYANINNTPSLSAVALSGSYIDLIDEPTSIFDLGITDTANNELLKTDGLGNASFTPLKTVNGNSIIGAGNIVVTSGQGLGSIVAYKADGSQDNIDITANTELTQIRINQELLMDASALFALESTSSYGWRDNIASFVVKATSGTANPSWITLFGGLEGYGFSATAMNQVWVDFHVDHDYALGTNLYPHVHWTPTTTATGTVRWGVEYSVAKGHQQAAFPATTTVYVEQTISTASQWTHFIAEVSDLNAIPGTNIEPDTVIKVRIFRDAAHPNDTYPGVVHAWQSDLHYRANRFATLNKAPSFNG